MKLSIGIGLLGCGTVGASVAERLLSDRKAIEKRTGVRYDLRAIAVRNAGKPRNASLPAELFTADPFAVLDDPQIDLIVECIGGVEDATELVERALDRGRHVVTANKDLLATQGPRLQAIAASRGAMLRYEAAVGGAIPIVRSLGDALAGDDVRAIGGVFNGTCTSILSAMEQGADYAAALAEAQRLGYAEANPSSDVDGHDAAHKLALLVQLAFGLAVLSPRIARSGISSVSQRDVARARMMGYRIRLVAAAVRNARGVQAEVAPLLVPEHHAFGRTSGAENVARIVARGAGALELRGAGAGGPATASAVLGDIVSALRAIGERHDLSMRGQSLALEPAHSVEPLFAALPHHPQLPRYRVWSDTLLDASEIEPMPRFASPGVTRERKPRKRDASGCPQA